jgi:hypothetical protein
MTDLRDLQTRTRVPRTIGVATGENRARARALENRTPSSSAGELTVSDGITTVDDVVEIDFTGATVTDEGGGVAQVAIPSGGGLSAVVATYAATVAVDASTPGGPDFGGNLVYGTELFSYGAGNGAPAALVTGLYVFSIDVIYTGAGDPGKFVCTELFWDDPVVLSGWTANEFWPLVAAGGPPGFGQVQSGPSASFWLTAGRVGSLNFETDSASSQTLGMNITVALIS